MIFTPPAVLAVEPTVYLPPPPASIHAPYLPLRLPGIGQLWNATHTHTHTQCSPPVTGVNPICTCKVVELLSPPTSLEYIHIEMWVYVYHSVQKKSIVELYKHVIRPYNLEGPTRWPATICFSSFVVFYMIFQLVFFLTWLPLFLFWWWQFLLHFFFSCSTKPFSNWVW
jgi:hypothetical protein